MRPLRQKMLDDMKLRRFAPGTQESYVSAVAGLAKHYNQSPDLLNKEKIQAYLLHPWRNGNSLGVPAMW